MPTIVVDPNTLYKDPGPEICPTLDLDPNIFTQLHYQFGKIFEIYFLQFILRIQSFNKRYKNNGI